MNQLDVRNAFLHGFLDEQVSYHQPMRFVDDANPTHVCLLDKSLYGLKQASRAWFLRFAGYEQQLGFVASRSDASLFTMRRGNDMAIFLLYVDDTILMASFGELLRDIMC